MTIVSKESRKELIEAVQQRYRDSTRSEKSKILDDFTAKRRWRLSMRAKRCFGYALHCGNSGDTKTDDR